MNRKQSVKSQTFRRVQQFGDQYRSKFPETAPIGQAFARLSNTVDAFMQDATAQHTHAREGRETHRAARLALAFRLQAIVRTAQVIAQAIPEGTEVPGVPGFSERFAMPTSKRHAALLVAGKGMLVEAEPLATQFIAHGLPETFVADLRTAVTDYEHASNRLEAAKLARASAQSGLRAAQKQAAATIRAIDVIIRYQFAHDVEMQGAWARAKRQDGLRLPKADANAPTSSPPSPAITAKPAIDPAA